MMQNSSRHDWIKDTEPFMYDHVYIGIVYHRDRNRHVKDSLSKGYILPMDKLPHELFPVLFPTKPEPNLNNGNNYWSIPSTHPILRTAMSILDIYINKIKVQRTEDEKINLLTELRSFLHEVIKNTRGATLETIIRY